MGQSKTFGVVGNAALKPCNEIENELEKKDEEKYNVDELFDTEIDTAEVTGNEDTSGELEYSDEDVTKSQISFSAESLTTYRKGRQQFVSGEYSTQVVKEYKAESDPKKKRALLSKIVETNSALVISIATKYSNYMKTTLEDAIQDGMLGLLKAIDRFDPDRGYMFSTYATWWIKQSVARENANSGDLIRIPVHARIDQSIRDKFVANYMTAHNGKVPTNEEIIENTSLTKEKLKNLSRYAVSVESYDRHIRNEEDPDDTEYIDLIDSNINVENAILNSALKEIINKEILSCLSERERDVIIQRFGLDGTRPKTLENVGLSFGLTRERIRQIEANAIKKMRMRTRRCGMTYASMHVEQ